MIIFFLFLLTSIILLAAGTASRIRRCGRKSTGRTDRVKEVGTGRNVSTFKEAADESCQIDSEKER